VNLTRRTKIAIAGLAGMAVLFATTAGSCDDQGNAARTDKTSASNFDAQVKNDPVPNLSDSLERGNIVEHLKRNNQPDRVRYIYLLADTGGIYAYYVIKGKVSSTAAQLTPTDEVVDRTEGDVVTQAATDDGVFGGDEGGIYFFTDTGTEIQWNGRWLLTDSPMQIKTPTLTLTEK
jgi:hypothetical protein